MYPYIHNEGENTNFPINSSQVSIKTVSEISSLKESLKERTVRRRECLYTKVSFQNFYIKGHHQV